VLLSMTGFGNGSAQSVRFSTSVEVKSVNNRHLKILSRMPDVLGPLEPEVERIVRESVARGTVNLGIRFSPLGQMSRYRIAADVLAAYWSQLQDALKSDGVPVPRTDALLSLPGVISDELGAAVDRDVEWPHIETAIRSALTELQEFRRREGDSMQADLELNCGIIASQLDKVVEQAPKVVANYRDRILERVQDLVKNAGGTVTETDLIREVSIFADRCDINEEITRLRCHIDEFQKMMNSDTSQGRKLDFLCQEMFREVNTIGSKANNVEIAHHVVEMKAALEKIREVLQNVE
jgi:uncharacterized protein (TIGR00255 family)